MDCVCVPFRGWMGKTKDVSALARCTSLRVQRCLVFHAQQYPVWSTILEHCPLLLYSLLILSVRQSMLFTTLLLYCQHKGVPYVEKGYVQESGYSLLCSLYPVWHCCPSPAAPQSGTSGTRETQRTVIMIAVVETPLVSQTITSQTDSKPCCDTI